MSRQDPWLSSYVPLFTGIRARAGEGEALDEYAAWFRKTSPEELKYQQIDCFEPMWIYHDHSAIAEAAHWLFNDPRSPWVPLLRATRSHVAILPLWRPLHVADGAGCRLSRGPDRRDGRQGPDGDSPSRRSPHDRDQDE